MAQTFTTRRDLVEHVMGLDSELTRRDVEAAFSDVTIPGRYEEVQERHIEELCRVAQACASDGTRRVFRIARVAGILADARLVYTTRKDAERLAWGLANRAGAEWSGYIEEMVLVGWSGEEVGCNWQDYFDGVTGDYLGADSDGLAPVYAEA